jgi:hypothetical protein
VAADRRRPRSPIAVARLVSHPPPERHFRGIVRLVAPDALGHIWRARHPGRSPEAARVAAFLGLLRDEGFELARHPFPTYYRYRDVTDGIPIALYGWDDEELSQLDSWRPGFQLLYSLCEPFWGTSEEVELREDLLDGWRLAGARPALVDRLPLDGFARPVLRARLGEGPFRAAADFADWIHGATGNLYLDPLDEEYLPWSGPNLERAARAWAAAEPFLDGVYDLAEWLEEDERAHGEALLAAALGDTPARIPPRATDN